MCFDVGALDGQSGALDGQSMWVEVEVVLKRIRDLDQIPQQIMPTVIVLSVIQLIKFVVK